MRQRWSFEHFCEQNCARVLGTFSLAHSRRTMEGGGKFVWVSGPSGGGKSFTGDYLETLHGFKHIDGDQAFFSGGMYLDSTICTPQILKMLDAQQIEYKNGIIKSFYSHWYVSPHDAVNIDC